MSHSSEKCFGKCSDQQSIKEVLGGALYNRADAIKHYKKYEHKWKKELKALKNKNKIIFIIDKKYGARRELKKIKNIKAKAYKKRSYSSSDCSSSESDSDSSLFSANE